MWGFRRPAAGSWAAIWMAVVIVAAAAPTGCTRMASPGTPVKSGPMLSVDPAAVLLDPHEVDAAMGISGAKVLDQGNAPDDMVDTTPPQCHGLIYIAGVIEYASTGFTAMGWRIVGGDHTGSVVQMVAQLPSVAKADQFIDTQTSAWNACAGKVITTTDKTSRQSTSDRVTAVRTGPHSVIASTEGGPEQSCRQGQHVLQAVSNIILDVYACGGTVADPAEAVAAKLADRILQKS